MTNEFEVTGCSQPDVPPEVTWTEYLRKACYWESGCPELAFDGATAADVLESWESFHWKRIGSNWSWMMGASFATMADVVVRILANGERL